MSQNPNYNHFIADPAETHYFVRRSDDAGHGHDIGNDRTIAGLQQFLAAAQEGTMDAFPGSQMLPGTTSWSLIYNVANRHWLHVLFTVDFDSNTGQISVHDSKEDLGCLAMIREELVLYAKLISMREELGLSTVVWPEPNAIKYLPCPQQNNSSDCAFYAFNCARVPAGQEHFNRSIADSSEMGLVLRREALDFVHACMRACQDSNAAQTPPQDLENETPLSPEMVQDRWERIRLAQWSGALVNPQAPPEGFAGTWSWIQVGVDDVAAMNRAMTSPASVVTSRYAGLLDTGIAATPGVIWWPQETEVNEHDSSSPTSLAAPRKQKKASQGKPGYRKSESPDREYYKNKSTNMEPVFRAPGGPRTSIPKGTLLNARQFSVSHEKWSVADKQKLCHLIEVEGLSRSDVKKLHFPHVKIKVLNCVYNRIKVKQNREAVRLANKRRMYAPLTPQQERRVLQLKNSTNTKWAYISEDTGLSVESLKAHWIDLKHKSQPERRKKRPNVTNPSQSTRQRLLTQDQAAFFILLDASLRSSDILYPVFPGLRADARFGNITDVLHDWEEAGELVLSSKKTASHLPLAFVLCFNLMDLLSDTPNAVGKTKCDISYSQDNEQWYADELWQADEQAEYRAQTPFERSKLSNVAFPYFWHKPDKLVMPFVVALASSVSEEESEKYNSPAYSVTLSIRKIHWEAWMSLAFLEGCAWAPRIRARFLGSISRFHLPIVGTSG
ncbi:uncharacterized protein MYCFIDRAFT_217101 [Pseudocercospora fijiensis CIRAD86]|uniref:Uncharacterized protein n=1 Tax=Pseudocercospora fijiensis (strain CIRAD86) TaxID=383855 RepID=M3AIL7_PSEFD|nr:uncharacterized protein MYCFIDRAFT_217101 [Pseudocercospora fijiensis CIRAD86]EME77048.1 hypothetical protein MYCFIDRAFT_217101 [Pseudocercospora fijiensis CIRAD86]